VLIFTGPTQIRTMPSNRKPLWFSGYENKERLPLSSSHAHIPDTAQANNKQVSLGSNCNQGPNVSRVNYERLPLHVANNPAHDITKMGVEYLSPGCTNAQISNQHLQKQEKEGAPTINELTVMNGGDELQIGDMIQYLNDAMEWIQGEVAELEPYLKINDADGNQFYVAPNQVRKVQTKMGVEYLSPGCTNAQISNQHLQKQEKEGAPTINELTVMDGGLNEIRKWTAVLVA